MIVSPRARAVRPLVVATAIALALILPGLPASAAGTSPAGADCSSSQAAPATAAVPSPTSGTALVSTLPTYSGTLHLVKDIRPGPDTNVDNAPHDLITVGTRIFFTANDGTHGRELWVTDGTRTGTRLVRNIAPGAASSGIAQATRVGGILLFTATDGSHGRELWVSDGTAAGTRMLRDIHPGSTGSMKARFGLTAVGRTVYFAASDGIHGRELWKSDGTRAGTKLVKDIHRGSVGSTPTELTAFRGQLLFVVKGGLWKSNGTAKGTVQVASGTAFRSKWSASQPPEQLTVAGHTLYFNVTSGDWGGCVVFETNHVWKSDGTKAGTRALAEVYPRSMVDLNGRLFFSGTGDSGHWRLWTSDGTVSGTHAIMPKVALESWDTDLTSIGGRLYWTNSSYDLWSSDGTYPGTVLLKNSSGDAWVNWGIADSAAVGGLVYFPAGYQTCVPDGDCSDNLQLWQTDGTPSGTVQTAVINPDGGAKPAEFIAAHGMLYMVCNDGVTGRELWRYEPGPN